MATELAAAFAAGGAGLATLLVVMAAGRSLLARQRIARRTQRFLDFTATPAAGAEVARPAGLAEGLSALASTHQHSLQTGLLALGLLVLGSMLWNVPIGLLLAAGAVGVAIWRALRESARRRALLEAQLAPALRLMASALESGYSVQQALERVVRDMPNPIAAEFAQVMRAVELGTPLEAALGTLAERGEDFDFLATIVSVQYRVGGDLPSLLVGLAATVQERLLLRAEVRALTAQARYSGWVLAFLPFFVLGWILLLSPSYATPLFATMPGRVMLVSAAILLVLGLALIRTISDVEL